MLEHGQNRYSTYYDKKYTDVYPLEDAVRAILCRNKDNEHRIKYLKEENKMLKEGTWKDEALQDMRAEYERMKADYYRGFAITEEEDKRIKEWQKKHEEEVHGLTTDKQRLKAGGTIGGRYSYHFVPTSIGTSGVVRCSCGAEFEFCELG